MRGDGRGFRFTYTRNGVEHRMPTWAAVLAWSLLMALGPIVWLIGWAAIFTWIAR